MKISTILDHIDSGHMALPEFQRGYVWNRDQVRGLFESLYRRHPVGSLLVWVTESLGAEVRGDGQLAPGVVKLLLDGQQRMTSLYGVARGKPPKFFEGNAQAFTGLHFHLADETFEFYQPIKMRDDQRWIDVSKLMQLGTDGAEVLLEPIGNDDRYKADIFRFSNRMNRILGIREIDLHIEEISGKDKTIDVVVDIFNRVNSGGTKLSKGDLALAKICAEWPEARDKMREALKTWKKQGFDFNLDWLLRNVNTVLTGEAKFLYLHEKKPDDIRDGLKRSVKRIDQALGMIGDRLGLDHDRVLFSRFAVPVMANYLDRRQEQLSAKERDRLLFWFVQSAMWGRYSQSTESTIDQDLAAIEQVDGGLDRLIDQLKLWHGSLEVHPGHFAGWSLGARFYPVLYMLTRVGQARDWGSGLVLKQNMLGRMSKLEVHHIFPKAQLYKAAQGYKRPEVNAIANYCFLTKESNLDILDGDPANYLPEIQKRHPGALESQWMPMNPELWKIENYREFLRARQKLLAKAANDFMLDLLHGDAEILRPMGVKKVDEQQVTAEVRIPGGVDSAEEEALVLGVNDWVAARHLPEGQYLYELADGETGEALAVLDLAWPNGLQEGLSVPVALLIDEEPEVVAVASRCGFMCFTVIDEFKRYVERDVLAVAAAE